MCFDLWNDILFLYDKLFSCNRNVNMIADLAGKTWWRCQLQKGRRHEIVSPLLRETPVSATDTCAYCRNFLPSDICSLFLTVFWSSKLRQNFCEQPRVDHTARKFAKSKQTWNQFSQSRLLERTIIIAKIKFRLRVVWIKFSRAMIREILSYFSRDKVYK